MKNKGKDAVIYTKDGFNQLHKYVWAGNNLLWLFFLSFFPGDGVYLHC